MKKPVWSWVNTLRSLGYVVRRKPRRKPRKNAALRLEELEQRQLLTTDVEVTDFRSDGANLLVDYTVANEGAPEFDLGVYRSANGSALDAQLFAQRVTALADRTVGSHTATISAAFSDLQED